jgi:hypothetical protein
MLSMTGFHSHDDDFLYEFQADPNRTTDDPNAKQEHHLSRHLRQLISPTKFPEFLIRISFFRQKPKRS